MTILVYFLAIHSWDVSHPCWHHVLQGLSAASDPIVLQFSKNLSPKMSNCTRWSPPTSYKVINGARTLHFEVITPFNSIYNSKRGLAKVPRKRSQNLFWEPGTLNKQLSNGWKWRHHPFFICHDLESSNQSIICGCFRFQVCSLEMEYLQKRFPDVQVALFDSS